MKSQMPTSSDIPHSLNSQGRRDWIKSRIRLKRPLHLRYISKKRRRCRALSPFYYRFEVRRLTTESTRQAPLSRRSICNKTFVLRGSMMPKNYSDEPKDRCCRDAISSPNNDTLCRLFFSGGWFDRRRRVSNRYRAALSRRNHKRLKNPAVLAKRRG